MDFIKVYSLIREKITIGNIIVSCHDADGIPEMTILWRNPKPDGTDMGIQSHTSIEQVISQQIREERIAELFVATFHCRIKRALNDPQLTLQDGLDRIMASSATSAAN